VTSVRGVPCRTASAPIHAAQVAAACWRTTSGPRWRWSDHPVAQLSRPVTCERGRPLPHRGPTSRQHPGWSLTRPRYRITPRRINRTPCGTKSGTDAVDQRTHRARSPCSAAITSFSRLHRLLPRSISMLIAMSPAGCTARRSGLPCAAPGHLQQRTRLRGRIGATARQPARPRETSPAQNRRNGGPAGCSQPPTGAHHARPRRSCGPAGSSSRPTSRLCP